MALSWYQIILVVGMLLSGSINTLSKSAQNNSRYGAPHHQRPRSPHPPTLCTPCCPTPPGSLVSTRTTTATSGMATSTWTSTTRRPASSTQVGSHADQQNQDRSVHCDKLRPHARHCSPLLPSPGAIAVATTPVAETCRPLRLSSVGLVWTAKRNFDAPWLQTLIMFTGA